MSTAELRDHLADEAKLVDPGTAIILLSTAAALAYHGTGALARLAADHARESIARIVRDRKQAAG